MNDNEAFLPNWASPPGDTIADILYDRHIARTEFALQLGVSGDELDSLLEGEAPISIEIARALWQTLGGSVEFWMSRDLQYRGDMTRIRDLEESWFADLPIRDMVRYGWILPFDDPNMQLNECLRFFDVESIAAWNHKYSQLHELAAFRTSPSFEPSPSATNVKEPKSFLPRLQSLCRECGVACVVVRSPDGCRASGATYFMSSDKAVIQLSFRYLTDDHFWFSFFHEAGHLLKHGPDRLFLELDRQSGTDEEREANDFAASTLIPPDAQERMMALRDDWRDLVRFAVQIGIAPGIVVGQLQHFGRLRRNQLNRLKRSFAWED